MISSVLAATISATPTATPSVSQTVPVTGNMEITVFLIVGATLLVILGLKNLLVDL